MPKNTIGGKHKHLKKNTAVEKKFTILEIDDNVSYAYTTKAYGNRSFDAIILKTLATVRFQAQYKRRKSRVTVGSLIKLSLVKDFTKETYVVEDLCCSTEAKAILKSSEYEKNYRKILQDNDMTYKSGCGDSIIEFDQQDDYEVDDNDKRPSLSYSDAVMISDDDDDDDDLDIDNL